MKFFIFDPDTSIKQYYMNFFLSEFPKVEINFFYTLDDFWENIKKEKPDLVIIEFDVEEPYRIFRYLTEQKILFIVVSHLLTERIIVESLKHGAYDFIYKKNLKFGYLKKTISRALLDIPKWEQILKIISSSPTYIEFSQYDDELKQISLQYSLMGETEFPILSFKEGNTYLLNFLTVKIIPESNISNFIISEEDLNKLQLNLVQKIKEIITKYNGNVWIYKIDSLTAVFHHKDVIDPILCALQIQEYLAIFLTYWESNIFKLISAIEQGTVTYTQQKQNVYSQAINLTYHMVEKINSNYKIFITENLFKNLDKRIRSYFFKENYLFEGNTIYHFEYIA